MIGGKHIGNVTPELNPQCLSTVSDEFFRITTWGESHGPALGVVVDGCPPGIRLEAADIQAALDKRKPGTSKFVTQRKESDTV